MLAAALLGFGIANLLLRNLTAKISGSALKIVIPCLILGTALCDLSDWYFMSKPGLPYVPPYTQAIWLGLLILFVNVKHRQNAAR